MTALNTLRIAFLASMLVGSILLAAGLFATHASAEGGDATVQIGSATLAVNGDVEVALRVLGVDAPGLGAWSVDIGYDAGVVAAVGCQPQNGSVCNPAFSPSSVRVTGAAATGYLGDTTLATIRFRCADLGSSPLTLLANVLADATIGAPQPLKTSIQNGSITCTAPLPLPTPIPTSPPPPPGPGSSGASFVVPGATYAGNIAGGGTIEITVNASGSGISSVRISNFSTLCGLVSHVGTFDPAVPIQNNQFILAFQSGSDIIYVPGTFLSNSTIEGTVWIDPDDPDCVQDARGFVATRVAPGLPTSGVLGTATGPNLPSAGAADGPAGWSVVNWYIAGLVGAGIAWLIAGLSGAGLALAGRGSGRAEQLVRAPEARRDGPLPEFLTLRPHRTTPRPVAPSSVRPVPQREAPRTAPRVQITDLNSIPSFVSLRRRPQG